MPDALRVALQIRADTQGAAQSLRRIERTLDAGAQASRRAARGAREHASALDQTSSRADVLAGHLRAAQYALQGYAAVRAYQVVGDIVRAAAAAQSLRSAMTAATGSAAAAQREFAFVASESRRLGLGLAATESAYVSLAAAARGTALEGQSARDIFTAVTEASRVMGLSSERTAGALTAVEQIISKGVVSAEELRGQLGERLPGAFQIAARAMGVTTAELGKMLQKGELLAEDLLPRFARELRRSVADGLPSALDSGAAALGRYETAVLQLQRSLGEGLLPAAAAAAEGLTRLIDGFRRLRAPGGQLQEDLVGLDVAALGRELDAAQARWERYYAARRALAAAGAQGQHASLERALAAERTHIAEIRALLDVARGVGDVARGSGSDSGAEVAPAPESESGAGPDAGIAALRALQEQFAATVASRQGALARLVLDESRAVGAIDALQGQLGVDEAARLALREATLKEYAARRHAILERQAQSDLDSLRRAEAGRSAEIERQNAAALAEAERLAAARKAAIGALDEGRRALATPYERAVAAIDRWEERTRAALATWSAESLEAETAYTELTQTAADLRARAAEDEAERRLQASTAWRDGAKRALLSYVDAAQNAGRSAEHFMQRSLRGMEDALTTFVTGGKLSFAGLVDSIVADLARLAVRQSIVAPLAASLGLAVGGGGIFGTVAHAGGIAGHGGRQRLVAPEVFRAAPRLHRGGIAGDEVPAILRRGEGVFTPEQMRALGQGAAQEQERRPSPSERRMRALEEQGAAQEQERRPSPSERRMRALGQGAAQEQERRPSPSERRMRALEEQGAAQEQERRPSPSERRMRALGQGAAQEQERRPSPSERRMRALEEQGAAQEQERRPSPSERRMHALEEQGAAQEQERRPSPSERRMHALEEQGAAQERRSVLERLSVEIVNHGTPGVVRESSASFDARGLVISIVTEDLATGGPIARGLQGSVPGMRL